MIGALLAAGAKLEARDEYGKTPLHKAAFNENPAVIEALLAAGAKLEAREKYGNTPLHDGSRVEQESGRDRVAAGGRSQTGGEGKKWRPRPCMMRPSATRIRTVIEALLEAGANPMAPNVSRQDTVGFRARQ